MKEATVKALGQRLLFPELYMYSAATASASSAAAAAGRSPLREGRLSGLRPRICVDAGSAAARAFEQTGIALDHSHVSVSHDGEYATAFVVLQRRT
jgi:phosphopantetheinyl transferase (holo-ACP synthase)